MTSVLALLGHAVQATPGDWPDPLASVTSEVAPAPPVRLPAARVDPAPAHSLRDRAVEVGQHAAEMVLTALNYLGVPYERGGQSISAGFDCSGFTRHVFNQVLGLVLPRRADDQARDPSLLEVRREELRPGDLVFFNTLRRTFSHVGIYIGDHRFVHAPRPGSLVRTEDMRLAYWNDRYTGARRAPGAEVPEPRGVPGQQNQHAFDPASPGAPLH